MAISGVWGRGLGSVGISGDIWGRCGAGYQSAVHVLDEGVLLAALGREAVHLGLELAHLPTGPAACSRPR